MFTKPFSMFIYLGFLCVICQDLLSNCLLSNEMELTGQFLSGPSVESSYVKIPILELDPFSESRNLRADHYLRSNEIRLDLFRPYLQNVKKGGTLALEPIKILL